MTTMRPHHEHLRNILGSGVCAPSAENKHQFQFQFDDESVSLVATDTASWVAQPHRRMLALLSFGAVVENVALRSAELGYALRVDWLPKPGRPDFVAVLRWSAAEPDAPADPLCHAIEARHTNRRFYRRTPLSAGLLAELADAAQGVPGTRLLWLGGPVDRSTALRAIRLAETERFKRRGLHQELFGSVRFDVGWAQATEEWLSPGALEVELPMRPAFALLRDWAVMRAGAWLGLPAALGFRAGYLPCALAPHLGLIVSAGAPGDLTDLHAGRAFQRVWLTAAAHGLALQPFASPTALARQVPGGEWVSAGVKARLNQLLLSLVPDGASRPCMFFRLGLAAPPTLVAGRLPLHHHVC